MWVTRLRIHSGAPHNKNGSEDFCRIASFCLLAQSHDGEDLLDGTLTDCDTITNQAPAGAQAGTTKANQKVSNDAKKCGKGRSCRDHLWKSDLIFLSSSTMQVAAVRQFVCRL